MSQGENPTEPNSQPPWWTPGQGSTDHNAPTASIPPVAPGRPGGAWAMPPAPPTASGPSTGWSSPQHTATPFPPTQPYSPIVPSAPYGAGYPTSPPQYPPTGNSAGGYPPPPGYPPASYHLPPSPPPPQRARGAVVAAIALIAVIAIVLGIAGGTLLNQSIRNSDAQTASGLTPNTAPSTSGGSANTYPGYPGYDPTGGIANGGTGNFGNGNSSNGSGSSGSGVTGGTGPSATEAASIAAKVTPALVNINTRLGYQQAAAAGTGMILTSNGEVLTNNHVISGATQISATVVGTGKTYDATVVGYSPTNDVAVLQLKGASGLPTVPLASTDSVAVNDQIVAAGNAGGKGGQPSVVSGTVTDTDQTITASDEDGSNSEKLDGLIQTNAPIEPGDSGGPLINSDGKVVGMDTAASATNQFQSSASVGYAIPINSALDVARQIESGKESDTIFIGLPGNIGIEVAQAGDSTVENVVSNSPAAAAGIQVGDTIISVNGQSIASGDALTASLSHKKPGDKVSVGWVDQSGQRHTASIALMTGPPR